MAWLGRLGGSRRVARVLLAALVLAGVGATLAVRFAPRRPNVLLVTIDTLRADHVGAYGARRARTPTLDALARRGARFDQAQSTVPLTGPSHASILTGLYPPLHGVRDNVTFVLDSRHPTLATRLKGLGYRTAAFVAGYPVAAAFGFGQGFDHFGEGLHESPAGGEGAERPANEVADQVLGWLASSNASGTPFFAWVHFYDPHAPYAPPAPYAAEFADSPYDGEIAFVDAQLARILAALEESPRAKETVVIVLADHGEALGEHGESAHAMLIYEATMRVPLLVAGPGIPQGVVVATRVSTVDVVPTILDLVGAPVPEGLSGWSLRATFGSGPARRDPLYSESLFGRLNCRWASLRGLTEGNWKLVDGTRSELFNLAEDPKETRDRSREEPARVERMRRALHASLHRMTPDGDQARPGFLSPEQEETLRSLGYAGGASGPGALDEPGLPDPRGRAGLYETLQKALAGGGSWPGGALAAVSAVVAEDPGNPLAHFTLAAVAYRSGELKTAGQAFSRTLELDPDRPGMRFHYGRFLRDTGQIEESERQLRIAVDQAAPDDTTTRVALAETLIARSQYDEAEAIVSAILARFPRHSDALRAMGRLLVARGRPREAVPYLEGATRTDEAEGWIELAEVQLDLGDIEPARASLGRAFAASPLHPWALAVAGRSLAVSGDRGHALTMLAKALSLRPRRAAVWLSLAHGFDAAGDPARAAVCRREALGAGRPS